MVFPSPAQQNKPNSPQKSVVEMKKTDESFKKAIRSLAESACGHSFIEDNRDQLLNTIVGCNKTFLTRLVGESAKVAKLNRRRSVTYDDLAELIHDQSWLVPFRDTFRKRITIEQAQARIKREEAARWAYDYSHFNRHKEVEDTRILSSPKKKSNKKRSNGPGKNAKIGKIRRKSNSSKSSSPKKRVLKKASK